MLDQPSARLLYMEDDPGLARLLRKTLQRQHYVVNIASNGEEGLAMLEASSYDALLIDYNMPLYSGIDVIRLLAQRKNFSPIIMVTGNGNEKVAVEALKLGAADYIVKDTDMGYLELLPIIIEQVLQKQQLIKEREQMFTKIQESEERYRKLVELSPDGIVIHIGGKCVFVNPAGIMLSGASGPEQLLGKSIMDFIHPDYHCIVTEQLGQSGESDANLSWLEIKLVRLDKSEIDVEITSFPFQFRGQPATQCIFRNITARKLAEQRLEQMAHFDALTGLPNRSLFFDRLEQALMEAKRYSYLLALMFIDLDGFKAVNDSLGHDAGDKVLKETARRLKNIVRGCDTAARMGGDEFTLILTQVAHVEDAELIAKRIINSFAKSIYVRSQECYIGASIGISMYPSDGDDSETLLKKADSAMYIAKQQGKNTYRFYNELQIAQGQ